MWRLVDATQVTTGACGEEASSINPDWGFWYLEREWGLTWSFHPGGLIDYPGLRTGSLVEGYIRGCETS